MNETILEKCNILFYVINFKLELPWRINNKFINAKKFVDKQIEDGIVGENNYYEQYMIYKNIIIQHMDNNDYDKAIDVVYTFLWNIFCDRWIEESKIKPFPNTLKLIIKDFEPLFRVFFVE